MNTRFSKCDVFFAEGRYVNISISIFIHIYIYIYIEDLNQ